MDKYQCSVSCHCDKESTEVHLYGSFHLSSGKCPSCGTIYTSTQVPTGEGTTRNEHKEQKSIRKIAHEISAIFE